MKGSTIKSILAVLLFSIHIPGLARNLNISTKTEHIEIVNDTVFNRNISVLIKQSSEESIFPIFYDYELERISGIKVYIKKGKRFKILEDPIIHNEDFNSELISSKRVKSIIIPAETEAKITYRVSCKELRYFSDLPLFNYDNVDTLDYQITIPETHHFFYNTLYIDSLKYLLIDSSKFNNQMQFRFKAVPVKVDPDFMMYFGIYRDIRAPLIRTTVIPTASGEGRTEYLNNWFLRKVETVRGLDSLAINKINEITNGITDSTEIANTLYNYVRTNFKYVAIEIGMGAFIPSHVNEVFKNKHGDCKDLSNFLCEALNYKGIKSHIALAATFHHICDCDFPSLCSANHIVCVAYLNNKPIVLDPTDPIHIPGTPVQSIQGKKILILNPNGGEYYKLNRFVPQDNIITYEIELNTDSGKSLQGKFKAIYTGISGNFLKWMFYGSKEDEKESIGKKYYESIFNNQSVTVLTVNSHSDTVNIEGKLSVDLKIFKDNDSRYLFIDFLPRLIDTENRETLLEGTHLGSTIDKKVKLTIKMQEPFKAFKQIEHSFSDKGISLDLKISNPADSIIECSYEFILDYIFIKNENLNTINEILKSYKKTINEPIILENKI